MIETINKSAMESTGKSIGKRLCSLSAAAFFFCLCGIFFVPQVCAQEAPRYEIGAHFSLIRLRDLDSTDPGVGTRFGFNITDAIGLEAEVTSFPRFEGRLFRGGRKTQALVGVKTGMRSEKFGIFAKLRPGIMRFSSNEVVPCPEGSACELAIDLKGQTNFALDLGGILEFYPSRRWMTRIDIGDTIIRFGDRSFPVGQSFTSHNLQVSVGFAVRF